MPFGSTSRVAVAGRGAALAHPAPISATIATRHHLSPAMAPQPTTESEKASAQARRQEVDEDHERDQDEEHRRGRRVVERPKIGLDVEADAARPDEAQDGGGAHVGLESVER